MFHEILAAWSTAAATLVALTLALIPYLQARWRRLSLDLEISLEDPYYSYDYDIGDRADYLKIIVHNRGRDKSEHTWVRFIEYSLLSLDDFGNLVLSSKIYIPAYIFWSSPEREINISIPAKQHDLLDLFKISIGYLSFAVDYSNLEDFYGPDRLETTAGFHCLEVSLGSDQAKPRTKYIVFELDDSDEITSIGVGDSPVSAFRNC